MVKDICFIGIVTQNREMRAFYQDILGLEVLSENPERFTYFATDARGRLELLAPHTDTARQQQPHKISFGLLVDDLDAALRALAAKGVAPTGEISGWEKEGVAQRWTFLRDPDGNVLLLLEQRGDELALARRKQAATDQESR